MLGPGVRITEGALGHVHLVEVAGEVQYGRLIQETQIINRHLPACGRVHRFHGNEENMEVPVVPTRVTEGCLLGGWLNH